MKKIEVGEYVRTKHDGILKIRDIKEEDIFNTHYAMGRSYSYSEKRKFIYYRDDDMRISIDDIVKHSKNIIDLIEVGDYVNGYKVIGVTLDPAPSGKCVDIDCDKPSYESYLFEEQIYSIVTHEQFTSMEYKVED